MASFVGAGLVAGGVMVTTVVAGGLGLKIRPIKGCLGWAGGQQTLDGWQLLGHGVSQTHVPLGVGVKRGCVVVVGAVLAP